MGHVTYFNQGMEEEIPNSLDKYFVSFFYLIVFYAFFKYSFHYFTSKNIPVVSPTIPFGNIKKALRPKKPRYQYFQDLYSKIRIRGHRHGGIYLFFKPIYMPVDLEYVANVLGEHFDYFSERGFYSKPKTLGENLLNLNGQKWKELRVALLPVFAPKNVRNFTVNVEKVSENLIEFLGENRLICIQDVSKNFNLDLVANLFFGVDLNSFVERDTPFEKHATRIFKNSIYNSKWFVFSILFPTLYKMLSKDVFPKESLKYFETTIREIIDFRETNRVKKNDMLQAILDHSAGDITIEDVISHCTLFATFTNETLSKVFTFALYELSRNPEIQDKLRDEIEDVAGKRQGDDVTYEILGEMTYLHQVLQETLRLYPIVPTILRRCTKEYNPPGTQETLDKGTGLLISILGMHRDPEFYENPNQFDPSRFSEENHNLRHPNAYLPYGDGPRMCPAIKFSMAILKVGLATVLRRFRFTLNERTKPLVLAKNCVLMQPKNSLYVNVEKL